MQAPLRIALIGSRELHKRNCTDDIEALHKVCFKLAKLGIIFRSGLCATGLDAIAQIEFSRAMELGYATSDQFEVFVYQRKNIDDSALPNAELAQLRNPNLIPKLIEIASSVHGNWAACSPYAVGQHTRNVHQIHGYNLDQPVQAVVTWCVTDKKGKPMGGTATAINLASQANIPVINLYDLGYENFIKAIHELLKQYGISK